MIEKKMQHNVYGIIMYNASHDTDGNINSHIAFLSSKMIQMRCNMTFQSFDTAGTGISII